MAVLTRSAFAHSHFAALWIWEVVRRESSWSQDAKLRCAGESGGARWVDLVCSPEALCKRHSANYSTFKHLYLGIHIFPWICLWRASLVDSDWWLIQFDCSFLNMPCYLNEQHWLTRLPEKNANLVCFRAGHRHSYLGMNGQNNLALWKLEERPNLTVQLLKPFVGVQL